MFGSNQIIPCLVADYWLSFWQRDVAVKYFSSSVMVLYYALTKRPLCRHSGIVGERRTPFLSVSVLLAALLLSTVAEIAQ